MVQCLIKKEVMAINRPTEHKKTKPIQSQYPARNQRSNKKQECQELFGAWIAGKLKLFDGFEILILTNADCRFTIATENRNS
jgi:hypothetical protein